MGKLLGDVDLRGPALISYAAGLTLFQRLFGRRRRIVSGALTGDDGSHSKSGKLDSGEKE
jgi:hypothetical protein